MKNHLMKEEAEKENRITILKKLYKNYSPSEYSLGLHSNHT